MTFDPTSVRSHVWLYPKIILSKSHENTSKYVDTVNLFAKTWTKGHWPLDDLWPHIWWGHMCDCAQGSLCPSPMGIRQCMWIQLSILQKLPHTYIHILRTYYVHTTYYVQNQWSHSLFLNYVQARQKKNPSISSPGYQMMIPPLIFIGATNQTSWFFDGHHFYNAVDSFNKWQWE